ncbi:MAG: arsenate reductase (glutaredoxin) [Phenylobacterium sp.]|nr:arsenate reductase (glutaredoxin) [Phenylobacterium sp.]MCA3735491.1 arsenate reductase (glutaredoxin) [Phenylobacterium sp.]MCA3736622.1 arsenate reductase (glutaredoxin) [Phenylobacterium sp.]MCA3741249.1 arsenate reductase (glutaredoxin) [Phenylobacterium sp.]MCA3754590.1 arsenate reductase (glutaredoxin) [Phenylobacterium sp.]
MAGRPSAPAPEAPVRASVRGQRHRLGEGRAHLQLVNRETSVSEVVIYHNPACGTSRNTLALLRERGVEPRVVEYLKAGWTEAQLKSLAARAGLPLRAFLRQRGTSAEALGLTGTGVTEDQLAAAMVREPILVERPVVDGPRGVAVCRPPEKALDLI